MALLPRLMGSPSAVSMAGRMALLGNPSTSSSSMLMNSVSQSRTAEFASRSPFVLSRLPSSRSLFTGHASSPVLRSNAIFENSRRWSSSSSKTLSSSSCRSANGSSTRTFMTTSQNPFFRAQHRLPTGSPIVSQARGLRVPAVLTTRGDGVFGFIARFIVSTIAGFMLIVAIILLHDSMTYTERHIDRVPTAPLALHPRKGGKKNLPIVEVNLGDEEDEAKKALWAKPKLVIIGGGWGAVAVLKTIPADQFNVTLIAPDNFNLFTPLLPSACVGTVEPRSLVEPLRKLIARVRGHYMSGKAIDLDMSERLVEVEVPSNESGGTIRCYVPYDKLVIGVGSTTNTYGVPGLEHCFQLKSIPDAQGIRRRIMNNLETASLPTTTPEERKRLLSFVVCGGGPTGVEFAAELADMMSEDVLNYFPKLLRNEMKIRIIQSRDHILNTYSEKISEYAEKRFKRADIEVIKNARVKEVFEDHVTVSIKKSDDKDAKPELVEFPAGFVLWSTGIAMNPFVRRLVEKLPNQYHSKAIVVDHHLRVKGSPAGTVYAVGDASTIDTNLVDHLMDLFEDADINKDGKLDYDEWKTMARKIQKKFPLAAESFEQVREIFTHYDTDKDDILSLNEVATAFMEISNKITTLPATAQVAAQQGEYLGKKFTKFARNRKALAANHMPDMDDEAYSKPFKYFHLGSLAYIGNSAVFDFGGYSFAGGLVAMYAWRSIYWSEQTSIRTRVLLMIDWIKRGIFGRDLSKF